MANKFVGVKKILFSIFVVIVLLLIVVSVVFSILGSKQRIGYFEVYSENIDNQNEFDRQHFGINGEYK